MNRSSFFVLVLWPSIVAVGCTKTDGPTSATQHPRVAPTAQPAQPTSTGPQLAPSSSEVRPAPSLPSRPETFTYGPPWGPIWCIHNSHIDAEAILSRHIPKGVPFLPKEPECAVGATAKGPNFRGGFTAMCGDDYMDISRRRGVVYSEELEANAYLQENESGVSLLLWLSKVPCHIMLVWEAPGGLEANHNSDINFGHYTIDGLGLPRACPSTAHPDGLINQAAAWKVEGDRLLTAASINSYDVTTPGEVRFRAAAFLYTKDGALLDTITVQEPYPASQRTRGRYAAEVTKSYGKCKSLMQSGSVPKFTFGCEVEWEDQECSVKPFEGKSYYIKVSDEHQLSIEEIPGTQSGRCKPKGGFPVVEH